MFNWLSVLFPFLKERFGGGLSPAVKWGLHVVVVLLVLVLLWYLNGVFGLDKKVPDPRWNWAAGFWLPLFGMLLYAAGWLVWLIWKLFMEGPEESTYPEIDEAWDEACAALDQAGISLNETPLFFVLGRPETGDEMLFTTAQLQLVVKQTPANKHAPLHVYANRDAIFVTCPGASLLGKHASFLALEELPASTDPESPAGLPDGTLAGATVMPQPKLQRVMRQVVKASAAGASTREIRARRRALGDKLPNLLRDSKLHERAQYLRGALAHLCRRMVRDRRPECPINGLLVVVPLGGTDTEVEAQLTADVLQEDLRIVRGVMKLHAATFALLCDMETLPGFRDFINSHKAEKLRRIGQRFPLASPDVRGESLLKKVDEVIQAFCMRGLRDLVYPHFDVRPADGNDAKNRGLFLFLDELHSRKEHLGRILANGLQRQDDEPLLFGGCYFAATGIDDKDQAFARGVLKRLIESQSLVRWTDEALREDQRYRRLAGFGYGVIAGLVLLVGGAGAYLLLSGRRRS